MLADLQEQLIEGMLIAKFVQFRVEKRAPIAQGMVGRLQAQQAEFDNEEIDRCWLASRKLHSGLCAFAWCDREALQQVL